MAILQLRSNRKSTGGRYKRPKIKRLGRLGRLPVFTRVGARKRKVLRVIGGNKKEKLLAESKVNVFDAKAKKHLVLDIDSVLENPANRHYVRRNILTKGSIVETKKGKVKITSRPGQSSVINGVLLSE